MLDDSIYSKRSILTMANTPQMLTVTSTMGLSGEDKAVIEKNAGNIYRVRSTPKIAIILTSCVFHSHILILGTRFVYPSHIHILSAIVYHY